MLLRIVRGMNVCFASPVAASFTFAMLDLSKRAPVAPPPFAGVKFRIMPQPEKPCDCRERTGGRGERASMQRLLELTGLCEAFLCHKGGERWEEEFVR